MHGRLSQISKTHLFQTPLLTPVIARLESPDEAGLAVRTANLFSFRRQELPRLIKPISYQGKEGVWIVAIVFHVSDAHGNALEGTVYLNPRKAWDLRLLQCLIKQDQFPILFLSPHLQVVVSHNVGWTVRQRQELRQMLTQATPLGASDAIASEEKDLDFERGKREFEEVYSIKNLFQLRTVGSIRSSSPFRGAVLD